MNRCIFTIIVIAYNVENYIAKCLNSTISQTTSLMYDVLVIDDGSTDSTSKIVDGFSKENEYLNVIHTNNNGSGQARNCGIDNAKGKWVMFLDGDDYLDNNALKIFEKIVDLNIDACYGRYYIFKDGYDNQIIASPAMISGSRIPIFDNGKDFFCYVHKNINAIDLGTKGIYRKDFLLNNNLFFKNYKRGQDSEWSLRMYMCAQRITYNAIPYYYYRKGRPGSADTEYSLKKAGDVLEYEYEWLQVSNMEENEFGYELRKETEKRIIGDFLDNIIKLDANNLNNYFSLINNSKIFEKSQRLDNLLLKLIQLIGAKYASTVLRFLASIKQFIIYQRIKTFIRNKKSKSKDKMHMEYLEYLEY